MVITLNDKDIEDLKNGEIIKIKISKNEVIGIMYEKKESKL